MEDDDAPRRAVPETEEVAPPRPGIDPIQPTTYTPNSGLPPAPGDQPPHGRCVSWALDRLHPPPRRTDGEILRARQRAAGGGETVACADSGIHMRVPRDCTASPHGRYLPEGLT